MKKLTSEEIEKEIYGKDGLYFRVIKKIETIGKLETIEKTQKRRTWIDSFVRQYYYPDKFKQKIKFSTITEIARMLGVE